MWWVGQIGVIFRTSIRLVEFVCISPFDSTACACVATAELFRAHSLEIDVLNVGSNVGPYTVMLLR